MARTLTTTFYLAIKKAKFSSLSARLTSKQPQLSSEERAIKLTIQVPESLFATPQLEFNVSVPEESVTPQALPVEVQENIKSLIEQQTGFSLTLNVIDKTTNENES